MRSLLGSFILLSLAGCAAPAPRPSTANAVPHCPADASAMDGWNDRAPPQRIYGNTWYVGTCGLSSLLITSPQGHVLIDGATESAAPLIEANIRALGFDLRDVKYILNSHEHHDHAAGIAQLQRDSGAEVLAREPALATLRRGASDRSDPQFLITAKFPPVATVKAIADGETVRVGPLALTAHATPGHTPGSTSWTWSSCQDQRCLDMAYTDSLTPISDKEYRYGEAPGVADAFRRTLDTIAALRCDVQITPHPVASELFKRINANASKPLIDVGACQRYADAARVKLGQRLSDERSGAAP